MTHYVSVGDVSRKRHVAHRIDGTLLYEEMIGEEGFSSSSSLLYHRYIPSAIARSAAWKQGGSELHENEPLIPRHFRLHDLFDGGAGDDGGGRDLVCSRRLVLGNEDVRISYVVADGPSPFYRNAIGDECVFLESGSARLESVFGALDVAAGDYVVIPRATTHRWLVGSDGPVRALCIEASSHITPPGRYLSKFGQFLESAPYCERDLRVPQTPLLAEDVGADPDAEVDIHIRHRGGPTGITGSVHTSPHHPLDAVGWAGCLYPYAFNLADYEPINGRVIEPPPVHQVFEGHNFVVCNFVPRKVGYREGAVTAPYYHANVDSDEVMFYVGGRYEARAGSGVANGSVTLHTSGHSHGPQPGAYEASIGVEQVHETAVMVDTFRPLRLGEGALATDDGVYLTSWLTP